MSEQIFRMLVRDEEDVVGALAYALYKLHKLEWLRQYQTEHGGSSPGIVIIGAAVLGLRASDALTTKTGQAVGTNATVGSPIPAPH